MKLKELLEAMTIANGKKEYVELVAISHVDGESVLFTYNGCLTQTGSLLNNLPEFVLKKEVIETSTPTNYRFGMNDTMQIVEFKKIIYIDL